MTPKPPTTSPARAALRFAIARAFWRGILQAFNLFPRVRPLPSRTDAEAIADDWAAVGQWETTR